MYSSNIAEISSQFNLLFASACLTGDWSVKLLLRTWNSEIVVCPIITAQNLWSVSDEIN